MTDTYKMDLCRQIDHMRAVFQSHNQMRGEELDAFVTLCYNAVFDNNSVLIQSLLPILNQTSQVRVIVNRLDNRLQNIPAPPVQQRIVIPSPGACCTKCDVPFIKYKRRTTLTCGCKYHKNCINDTADCIKCGKVEAKPECSICIDAIDKKTQITTICNHTYHKKCLIKWKHINKSCPMCRHAL